MSVPGTPCLPQLSLLTELVHLPGLPRPPGSSWGVGLEVTVDSTPRLCRGTRRLAQGLRGVCLGSAPPASEPGLIHLASHWPQAGRGPRVPGNPSGSDRGSGAVSAAL